MIIAIDIGNGLPKDKPTDLIGIARRSLKIMHKHLSKSQHSKADVVIAPKMNMDILEDDMKIRKEFYMSLKKQMRAKIPEIRKIYHQKVLKA